MVQISGSIKGAVAIVVVTVVLLAMTPTVIDQVQSLNTSTWTFTGYEGAIALIGLVPFLWVAGILAGAKGNFLPYAVGMFTLYKGGKG